MFNYYFILLIFSKIVFSPEESDIQFTTWSCYESLSSPIQFIELYNFFPTSPPNLYINFAIKLYGQGSEDPYFDSYESYNFKRINGPCKSSIKFTTMGLIFEKMILIISINFFHFDYQIAQIIYTFYNNFNPGFYLFIAKLSNIGLFLQVMYHGSEHIQTKITDLPLSWSYLEEITYNYTDICVVTYNNLDVVIRPDNIETMPPLIIIAIMAEYTINGIFIDRHAYPAFSCQSDEFFPNSFVYIVDEQPKEAKLNFKVAYIYNNHDVQYVLIKDISIEHIRRINIYKSKNMPSCIKKVYFINNRTVIKRLQNNVILYYHLTSLGVVYLIREFKNLNVSSYVTRWQFVTSRSTTFSG